ncbi:hypothetical protein Chor_002250, partial [Crotalus horridus]
NHCHYQGYVEGISDSTVALSTCFGLRGLVQIQDTAYGIEPINSTSRHVVYRMENVKKPPRSCGVSHLDGKWETADAQPRSDVSLTERRKRSVLQQTRYVELFIVVDKERYYLLGQNKTAVREEMVQLANLLDNFGPNSVQAFASIVAHELGHNLGMNHDDDRNCRCETGNCIMNSGASGARNFSTCSEEDFEKLTLNKGGSCLLNLPRPGETYSIPYCGNKLVDAGEECDCGSVEDVTIQNGHPCHQDKAYCYDGVCQDYELQCQDIFGPQAKVAPKICFSDVNSKGDRFGNCGYQNREYRKCSSCLSAWEHQYGFYLTAIRKPSSEQNRRDGGAGHFTEVSCLARNALCGKLQCENVETLPVFRIKPAIIRTPIKDTTCWGVDFQLGSDVPDPGMVNEGTKCAPGKVCKHYQCVNASVLDYDCDTKNKCNGHGVCNSNKNCHCNSEWAPPYCDSPGYGGSIDSGPTYNGKFPPLLYFALKISLQKSQAFGFEKEQNISFVYKVLSQIGYP